VKERITIGLPTSPVFMTKQIPSRQESDDSEKDDLFDADDKKYRKYMSTLDPTSAKDQDHYRVLGLSTLRYRATPDNIKQAC
jgi:DnaJ family protein C protein 2